MLVCTCLLTPVASIDFGLVFIWRPDLRAQIGVWTGEVFLVCLDDYLPHPPSPGPVARGCLSCGRGGKQNLRSKLLVGSRTCVGGVEITSCC